MNGKTTISDKAQKSEEKWTVRSVNGQETIQEREWKSLAQIEGEQTLVTNNLFGISFRIIPIANGQYRISEFSVNPSNIYNRLMEEAGMDTKKAYAEIKRQLESGEWTETNIRTLMDYGVIEGINRRLDLQDQANHYKTNNKAEFLDSADVIIIMSRLESDEYFWYKPGKYTDEEKLRLLEKNSKDYPMDKRFRSHFDELIHKKNVLIYQKYNEIVRKKQNSETYGANSILEYMNANNFTLKDLSLALAMAEATKSGVIDAECHIIDTQIRLNTIPNKSKE